MLSAATLKTYKMEIAEFKRDIKRMEREGAEANKLSIAFCKSQIKMREEEMGA